MFLRRYCVKLCVKFFENKNISDFVCVFFFKYLLNSNSQTNSIDLPAGPLRLYTEIDVRDAIYCRKTHRRIVFSRVYYLYGFSSRNINTVRWNTRAAAAENVFGNTFWIRITPRLFFLSVRYIAQTVVSFKPSGRVRILCTSSPWNSASVLEKWTRKKAITVYKRVFNNTVSRARRRPHAMRIMGPSKWKKKNNTIYPPDKHSLRSLTIDRLQIKCFSFLRFQSKHECTRRRASVGPQTLLSQDRRIYTVWDSLKLNKLKTNIIIKTGDDERIIERSS